MAPPRPPSFSADDDSMRHALLGAASGGNLHLLKRLARALDKGRGCLREAVEAAKEEGTRALHHATRNERIAVCRYLVEELGVDVDAVDDEARTPLIWAILGTSVATVRYLLDHGVNPSKYDDEGFTPLHYAAGSGNIEMMELLLAKGFSVDPVSASGTPLHLAAFDGHDDAVKILLDHNADYNKVVPGVDTPLLVAITGSSVKCVKLLVEAGADVNDGLSTPLAAAANKGLTACLKCLLEAGADPNVSDPSGRIPIEIAALKGARQDVEILFPATSCIPTVHDWSVDGIIHHATSMSMKQGGHSNERRIAELKSCGVKSVNRKDYLSAAIMYSVAIEHDSHDATLFSNRSLCWLRKGDKQKALLDALACREMRPDWTKACYRQGAALMLFSLFAWLVAGVYHQDYESACNAVSDASKLDPKSPEIEAALREALNSLKISRGTTSAI